MRQTNEINATELFAVYRKCYEKPATLLSIGSGDNKVRIEVKHRLSADEMTEIVDNVCNSVIDVETGSFHLELKDYYLRVFVLETYTNLSLPEGSAAWDLIYGTPVFAMVTGHDKRPVTFGGWEYDDNEVIDVEQYEQLITAIDQKIEYLMRQSAVNDIIRAIQNTTWSR